MSQTSSHAILIHTTRGGGDPDEYWTVVTSALMEQLNEDDPWRTLGEHIDAEHPGVIADFVHSKNAAACRAELAGYKIKQTIEAVGY